MSASGSSVRLWFAGVGVAWLIWRATSRKSRALRPRPDQISALFDRAPAEGKIHILNLIKFNERASYDDGRVSELAGSAAYALYDEVNRKVIAEFGGRVLFSGDANTLIIGPGAQCEYDRVVVFEFPSMDAYNNVAGRWVDAPALTRPTSNLPYAWQPRTHRCTVRATHAGVGVWSCRRRATSFSCTSSRQSHTSS